MFEIIERNIQKANLDFLKIFFYFTPSIFIAFFFITSPISEEQWMIMAGVLKNEFGQNCYMSCGLLNSKSTIIQQFQGNLSKYSLEVFLRYFLIIVIGFFPLHILYKNSFLRNKNLILFNKFKKIVSIFSLSLIPVLLLFAMGYDWGRWVNITYVLLAIVYFYLYKKNLILLNKKIFEENIINKLKGKIFIFFFIVYCFGWNPKTVISGDVASFPGYRIPYKVFKVLLN